MSYTIDNDLQAGLDLLNEGKKVDTALKLINRSARKGTTKGKSYFEVGRIIREGIPGLEADPEESKKFYDIAADHFNHEPRDSMDNREYGDYYYYGLGSEEADKNRALEYYDAAAADGDELAKQRADEIRGQIEKGDSSSAPTLTPETDAKEEVVEAVNEDETVVAAPVVENENKPAEISDKVIQDEIDSDQILIKAIRVLDSVSATDQERLDAVELARIAAEEGSIRANVLLGWLYEGDNNLVEADLEKAKEFYEIAIEHGSCSAEFRLGMLYTDKDVPFCDVEKGHQLIIDAAHDGYTFALCYLGDCFRTKVDDVRNLEVAYRYYALAGERGLGLGYHYMAEIDASRQQLDLAAQHEKLATDNGYDPALGYQDPLFYSLHV
jgi:TPR repeat protein